MSRNIPQLLGKMVDLVCEVDFDPESERAKIEFEIRNKLLSSIANIACIFSADEDITNSFHGSKMLDLFFEEFKGLRMNKDKLTNPQINAVIGFNNLF